MEMGMNRDNRRKVGSTVKPYSIEICSESPIFSSQWKEETVPSVALTTSQIACERLRKLARDCLEKNQHSSLTFYADKLVVMSKGNPSDVLLLAQAYYRTQEYRRAVNLMRQYQLLDTLDHTTDTLQFRYLAAQCMIASKDWDECFSLLESTLADDEESVIAQAQSLSHKRGEEVNLIASLCVIRGNVYEATENRDRACMWYGRAIKCDIYCTEAFFHLVDRHMISSEEEVNLLNSLNFNEEDEWLRLLYASNIGKYETSPTIESKFQVLEKQFGLEDSLDIAATKAKCHYYQHATEKAYTLSKWIREKDPFHMNSIPVYVSTLVDLKKNIELFYCAHRLVESYPNQAISWFAVGCYYLLVKKFAASQRYFEKATSINPNFAPAWIGFGNAFAAQDESDHAMASYRTASRIFPGSHLPLLCIGMEYLRTNNLTLACQFIQQAARICPADPLVYNELGAVCFKQGRYEEAAAMFEKALGLCLHLPKNLLEKWEPTMMNLAHAYRKLKYYNKAIGIYQKALALCPKIASTHSSLGFTYHLQGKIDLAIDCYHKALGLKPGDTFTTEMLSRALGEALDAFSPLSLIQENSFQSTKISTVVATDQNAESSLDMSMNSDTNTFDDDEDEDDDDSMSL